MKVHATKFVNECRIPIEHIVAAGFELGFTSLEEAVSAMSNLRLPKELVFDIEKQLEQQKQAAKLAAQTFFKNMLEQVLVFEELEPLYIKHHLSISSNIEIEKLYYERKIALATTIDHARQMYVVPERISGHGKLSRKALDLWEKCALEAAQSARNFKQAWNAYLQCPNYTNPSATLALEKVKKFAKTKEQLLRVCEKFKPYDPRDEEIAGREFDAEKPSERYLFFVKKLAAKYFLPEATT